MRAHSFLPLSVIKSYIIPKTAKRTRKKGIINNVINATPPVVLAIMYSFETAHQKNNRSSFVQKTLARFSAKQNLLQNAPSENLVTSL